MKKMIYFTALSFLLVAFCGCYSTRIVAPSVSTDVRLMKDTERASVKISKKNWYVLWGLVSLSSDSGSKLIEKNGLKEVKAETKFTFIDYIITGVLGIATIATNTTIIEGN